MPRARTTTAGCLTLLTAATAALSLVSAGQAQAGSATYLNSDPIQVGHTSGYDFGPGLTIQDAIPSGPGPASVYPSTASIGGMVGSVTDVDVFIAGFKHGWPTDVDIMLAAPSGESVVVMSDVGGGNGSSSPINLYFDDAAANAVPALSLPAGTFRPTDSDVLGADSFPAPAPSAPPAATLSAFNGLQPNGDWKLFVVDDLGDFVGSVFQWSVYVKTTGSAYPSTIQVAGTASAVTDVDVHLDGLTHARPADVDLLLVGPQGQQASILSDVGGSTAVTDVDLVLDDEADAPVGSPLSSGRHRPVNAEEVDDPHPSPAPEAIGGSTLSVFDGTDADGTWRLFVVDDASGAAGSLDGWSLRITTNDPAPSPTATPTPTAGGGAGDNRHPRVGSTSPRKAADGVRRGADVVATLDEPVRRATVTSRSAYLVAKGTTRRLAATVTYRAGTRRVVIDPAKRLRPGTTYKAVVTTAVTDLAGNRLDQIPAKAGLQPKTWRFTTR